jgi:hypothetical protein
VRTIVLALAALVGAAAPARADVLPQFVGVPGGFVADTPFSFELRAPGLNSFTDFNLDLIVQTASLDPVSLLSVTVDRPADADYPFGTTGTFGTSQSAVGGSPQFTVNISGATGAGGVNTTAGVNDLLARITVTPGPGFFEPITFSIDSTTFTLSALAESGQGIQTPDPVTVFPELPQPPDPTANPVPAPAGVVLLGLGGVGLLARGRFGRRA